MQFSVLKFRMTTSQKLIHSWLKITHLSKFVMCTIILSFSIGATCCGAVLIIFPNGLVVLGAFESHRNPHHCFIRLQKDLVTNHGVLINVAKAVRVAKLSSRQFCNQDDYGDF